MIYVNDGTVERPPYLGGIPHVAEPVDPPEPARPRQPHQQVDWDNPNIPWYLRRKKVKQRPMLTPQQAAMNKKVRAVIWTLLIIGACFFMVL
jgi:hypothetical protein